MKAFRNSLKIFFALSLVALSAAWTDAAGQGRDMRVVSARAGGVNYVLGDVKFRRKGAEAWKTLTTSDTLDSGDAVRTGTAAVVEVLLNPGSYLRAGGATEFELADASLDELRLRVERGSVVIEAVGYGKEGLDIRVETPQTQTAILETGVYRYNVTPAGLTEVVVQKGRALVGAGVAAVVAKEGRVARVGGGGAPAEVAKYDKKTRDELDQWSRERGKELAEANSRVSRRQVNTLLASVNTATLGLGGGFWYFDPRRNCYVFMPLYGGWRSPYGGWYNTALYYSDYCRGCYNNDPYWDDRRHSAGSRPPSPTNEPREAPRNVSGRHEPVSSGGWANKDSGPRESPSPSFSVRESSPAPPPAPAPAPSYTPAQIEKNPVLPPM